jgi:hypothetical protein
LDGIGIGIEGCVRRRRNAGECSESDCDCGGGGGEERDVLDLPGEVLEKGSFETASATT